MSEECAVKAWRRAVRWLAERLSEARVLPSWKRCHGCAAYGFDACAACWQEAAMEAAREEKRMTDKEWARQCAMAGWKVLATFAGCLLGWALVRWIGWW